MEQIQNNFNRCRELREITRPMWNTDFVGAMLRCYQLTRLRDETIALIMGLPEEQRDELLREARRY
jgi:hypothetical protein